MYTSREIEQIIGPIPTWHQYEPNDIHYIHFATQASVLASAYKIADVYDAFCNARAGLLFAWQDNLREFMDNTDDGLTFFRSHLLLNSLVLYNICIDLSWQVVWLRYETNDIILINNTKVYESSLKHCNLDALRYRLSLAQEYKVRNYITATFESSLWQEVREHYNYYKHRGNFHVGIGENPTKLMFSYNGTQPKCLSQKTFNLNEWTGNLIKFHQEFSSYFETIIKYVIPSNYSSPIGTTELIKYMHMIGSNSLSF